jgi:hypothetical protein
MRAPSNAVNPLATWSHVSNSDFAAFVAVPAFLNGVVAGQPLADLVDLAWFEPYTQRLDQLHLRARVLLADAKLGLGQGAELIGELLELCGGIRCTSRSTAS